MGNTLASDHVGQQPKVVGLITQRSRIEFTHSGNIREQVWGILECIVPVGLLTGLHQNSGVAIPLNTKQKSALASRSIGVIFPRSIPCVKKEWIFELTRFFGESHPKALVNPIDILQPIPAR
jgi:hypothetical protein